MRNFFALFLVTTLTPSLFVAGIWGTLWPVLAWSAGAFVFLATPKPPKVNDMILARSPLGRR